MEEDRRQILEEILAKADALMVQCAELKNLVSSCLADGAVHETAAVDEDLPEAEVETVEDDLPEAEPVEPGEDLPEADVDEGEPEVVAEAAPAGIPDAVSSAVPDTVPEVAPETVAPEAVVEDLPENEAVKVEEDLPEITPVQPEEDSIGTVLEEPKPSLPESYAIDLDDDVSVIPIFEKARKHKESAVVDALASKESWRTDLPGSKVSDIRSAISLNDRILFINNLFGEDPAAFKETLTELNAMTSFEDGVTYVESVHPEWDMESDTVYRFMMAVRRRLQ